MPSIFNEYCHFSSSLKLSQAVKILCDRPLILTPPAHLVHTRNGILSNEATFSRLFSFIACLHCCEAHFCLFVDEKRIGRILADFQLFCRLGWLYLSMQSTHRTTIVWGSRRRRRQAQSRMKVKEKSHIFSSSHPFVPEGECGGVG